MPSASSASQTSSWSAPPKASGSIANMYFQKLRLVFRGSMSRRRTPGTAASAISRSKIRVLAARSLGLALELRELAEQEGGVELAQAVVAAERVVASLGILGPAAIDDRHDPLGEVVVIGQERPTLAGGQDLRALVAERAERPDAPGASPVPGLAVAVGAVLDDRQSVPLGDRHDPVHVGHDLAEVDRDDRPSPGRDRRLDGVRIDRPGAAARRRR